MKRLFLILTILLIFPGLLAAQTLSLKSVNDDLHTNYSTTTVYQAWVAAQGYLKNSDFSNYRLVADSYTTSEVDTKLSLKLDASAISAYRLVADSYSTSEVDSKLALKLDASVISGYATTASVATKANSADVYTTAAVDLLLLDKSDTAAVALKADKTYVDGSDEVFLAHTNATSGAHAASAISSTNWTNVQTCIDSIENAINGIITGSGFATMAWTNSTLETNFYTQAQTNATIEAAIANATAEISTNKTVSVTAGEDLTVGDVVSLINNYGSVTAVKNNLSVNTSPNGAESVFNSAATTYCSAVALDSTRFLVAYKDSDTYLKAIVGTVSGSSISWGSESSAFEISDANQLSVCKIDTDKVLAIYKNNNVNTKMVVLSIVVSTITVGTPAVFDNNYGIYTSATTLDTNKALVCFFESKTNVIGAAKIVTISGTTPTPYPDAATAGTTFNAASTNYISVSALSSTSAIVAYQDSGNSNYGTAQVLSISGTTITAGTEYVFKSASTAYVKAKYLTTNKAVILYSSTTTDCLVATNSSGTLSYGTAYSITALANGSTYHDINIIDTTRFLFSGSDSLTSNGKDVIGNINGDVITYNSVYTHDSGTGNFYSSNCYLGNNKSIICYQDQSNSSYGTAVVNTWGSVDYSSVRGISTTTTTSGSDAVVLLNGTASGLSSIIPGSQYWLAADYSMSTAPVSLAIMKNSSTQTGEIYLGTGLSTSTIYFSPDFK